MNNDLNMLIPLFLNECFFTLLLTIFQLSSHFYIRINRRINISYKLTEILL